MLTNLIFRSAFGAFKNTPKVAGSDVEKEGSKIIVDPEYFRKTGILASMFNRFKNSNTIFEAKRFIQGF